MMLFLIHIICLLNRFIFLIFLIFHRVFIHTNTLLSVSFFTLVQILEFASKLHYFFQYDLLNFQRFLIFVHLLLLSFFIFYLEVHYLLIMIIILTIYLIFISSWLPQFLLFTFFILSNIWVSNFLLFDWTHHYFNFELYLKLYYMIFPKEEFDFTQFFLSFQALFKFQGYSMFMN